MAARAFLLAIFVLVSVPGFASARDLPRVCDADADTPDFGPLAEGSLVRLGRHDPVGPDGSTNWLWPMAWFVGREARVTSLGGLDDAGCAAVFVDVDGGRFAWRVRNLEWLADPGITEEEVERNAEPPPLEADVSQGRLGARPRVFRTRFSGSRPTGELVPGTNGMVSAAPALVLHSTGVRFARIVVDASFDATLIVELPNGERVFADDVDGNLPILQGPLPRGDIRIYVGSFRSRPLGEEVTIAISTSRTLRAADLREAGAEGGEREGAEDGSVLHAPER